MAAATPPYLINFIICLSFLHVAFSGGTIGVNYGRIADNLPDPTQVVKLLNSNGVTRIKLFDTEPTVLKALSGSGISVIVALPNEHLSSAAQNQTYTDTWVQSNILPYIQTTTIDAIAVGNEVFTDPNNTTEFLVPAMKNVYASLMKHNLSIKVSSPVALAALGNSYPSSAGSFKPDLIEPVIKPMLKFLRDTGSYFMVNAYPFFAYEANANTISLDYTLFRDNNGDIDPQNGITYRNLLDAQLDAVSSAMDALQFNDIKIVVTETGWPSLGDPNEVGAGVDNAAQYHGNLVRRVLTGGGTPLRPNDPLSVYLFALFNENQKPGPTSERNFGLFYPNEQKVYDAPLSLAALMEWQSAAENGSTVVGRGQTWCVANKKVGKVKLQAALDYACGEGGTDCRPIQKGATCYDPNTVVAHASFAFNSYYQKQSRRSGTCDFAGAAHVVRRQPRFGNCKLY